ncbi:MAG: dipeptide ABC transporter ATP-binding protein [Anaerolineaceae bacterium]|nr:dipeptide ABC transporter ATP-binding protein [Anaerolineaceae bacterium]
MERDVLLRVEGLKKYFPVVQGKLLGRQIQQLRAVDDVSFEVYKGETLGLVGESGCGKSTTGRSILQLYRPTGGKVFYDGTDLMKAPKSDLRRLRQKMQMIFQDPYASLNPRMTVSETVGDPIRIHKLLPRQKIEDRVKELLEMVGLNPAFANRYPHEFSGGQRQRIGIARALALQPDLIICDEPISALDVSIQAQVVNLLEDLQEKLGLTYLFIAHDLSMVRHISTRVAVMYLGVIVELADRTDLYENPLHPYTRALLSAVPIPDPKVEKKRERIILTGDVPSPIQPPSGCRFRTRCPLAADVCAAERPAFREVASGHSVACHFAA